MKVLHLSTERAWRGGENQLRYLVRGAKAAGIDSHIVLQPQTSFAEKFAGDATIHEVRMRNDADIFAAAHIAKICSNENIDMIHAQSARGHTLGLLTKKYLRLTGAKSLPRLIVHRRVEHRKDMTWADRWKYLNVDVDHFICVSKAIARDLAKNGVSESKLSVVHSAVDPLPHLQHDAMREQIRSDMNISSQGLVVSCVAAMEEAKGVTYLLNAWDAFLKALPSDQAKLLSPKLWMIGQGNQLETLKSQYVSDSIVFTGFRNDVPRLMAGSDILVLPTLWEGLGTVLLDGLLAGCAPVASEVGGVPEIVIHEKTGLLVPARNSDAIKQALLRLTNDPELRKKLVVEGQKNIAANFSLEAMVHGNIKIYRSLLGAT